MHYVITNYHNSTGLSTQNPGFGSATVEKWVPKSDFEFPESAKKCGLRKVEQGFSSFFAIFLAYLMIFQSGARRKCCRILENNQI